MTLISGAQWSKVKTSHYNFADHQTEETHISVALHTQNLVQQCGEACEHAHARSEAQQQHQICSVLQQLRDTNHLKFSFASHTIVSDGNKST